MVWGWGGNEGLEEFWQCPVDTKELAKLGKEVWPCVKMVGGSTESVVFFWFPFEQVA